MARLPTPGGEYLFLGPMVRDVPERCVALTEVYVGDRLFEVRGDAVVDRDGSLLPLTSLRPSLSTLPAWADPSVLARDNPAEAISAEISRHLPPWLALSPAQQARVPLAKRCADAAGDIGGRYATVADVLAALFAP